MALLNQDAAKSFPKGYWYVFSVVQQEPKRYRAWCGPKGSSRYEAFDATTCGEAKRLASQRCDEENGSAEGGAAAPPSHPTAVAGGDAPGL